MAQARRPPFFQTARAAFVTAQNDRAKGSPAGTNICSLHVLIAGTVFLLGIVLFCFALAAIIPFNGWWLDELFSVWASDPSLSFSDIFLHRIIHDATPPVYYSSLFLMRHLIAEERTAIVVLNMAALTLALLWTGMASRRAGELGVWVFAGTFFLLSGPVLRYTLEGRAYLMAMSATFVACWLSALAIKNPDRRPDEASFALIGFISAMIHFYAALMCFCLAVGILALSSLTKKKDLLGASIALGFCACAATAINLPLELNSVSKVRWTELSMQSLLNAYWQIREVALGSRFGMFFLIGISCAGFVLPATRKLTMAFAITFVLFFALPILISLRKPIIGARYWLIGAPAIIVLISFVTAEFVASAARARLFWIGAFFGLSFLVIGDGAGFVAARADTANKLIWRGADIAAPLLKHCPSRSVHVYTSWGFIPGFAFVAHVPDELFINVDDPAVMGADKKNNSNCPVLGWAEHVLYRGGERVKEGFVLNASDDELLALLKISKPASEVDIYRHKHGYVVLSRGALRTAEHVQHNLVLARNAFLSPTTLR